VIVDYAWGYHPGHAKALAKAGVTGVLRYCSRDPNKDISSFEVKELKAAGIQIGLVYETSADWMLGGYARGVTAGTEALLRAKKAGLTPGILYLGADFDVSAAQQSNIDDAIRGGNRRDRVVPGVRHRLHHDQRWARRGDRSHECQDLSVRVHRVSYR